MLKPVKRQNVSRNLSDVRNEIGLKYAIYGLLLVRGRIKRCLIDHTHTHRQDAEMSVGGSEVAERPVSEVKVVKNHLESSRR